MPIAINGSGTITGISVGGLPDGIVDTDMLAAGAVTAPKRGAGAILQVVQGTKTNKATTTSTSMVDTGLSASITPSATSSKILIHVQLGSFSNQQGGGRAFANIVRDSTDIFLGDATTGHEVTIALNPRASNDEHVQVPCSIHFLDSPSTTSATTYKVQMKSDGDGGTVVLNSAYDTDSKAGNTGSSIILMEVAA